MSQSTTGNQLAVVSQSGCTVSFFDLDTGLRGDILDVLPEGHELCFDPARRVVYLAHTYRDGFYLAHSAKAHEITVIDVDTHKIVEIIDIAPEHGPHGMAIGADGLLYVSVEEGPAGPGALIAVDPATGHTLARHSAEAAAPHSMILTPDHHTAFTTNKQTPFVSKIDLTGVAPLARIPVTGSEGLALSSDGARLFVATPAISIPPDPEVPDTVEVFDTASAEPLHTIAVAHTPVAVHVTADEKLLVGQWIRGTDPTDFASAGVLTIFDARGYTRIAETEVGRCPINIISAPDAATAYVSNLQSGTVCVVDLRDPRVTRTLEIDLGEKLPPERTLPNQGAHGVAFIPPTD
ncbi:YncE family protein [Nocardia pseudobrasiliensis]|nr:hypothetical protein [Nocardia pseudobrasiliensis]